MSERMDNQISIRQMQQFTAMSIGIYHVFLFFLFFSQRIWIMVGANVISCLVYILAYRFATKEENGRYFRLVYWEILMHMLLVVIVTGGDCGFELYGFALIPIVFYNHYVLTIVKDSGEKIDKGRYATLAITASIGIKIYSILVPPLMQFGDVRFRQIVYLVNMGIIAITVVIFQDIYAIYILSMRDSLMRKNELLDIMSKTDAMTGIYNRRAINEFHMQARQQKQYAVIMADIDNFKQINDTYGHVCGDKVLIGITECFTRNIRVSDMLCRWGGEEILVLLNDCGLQTAGEVAEKIRLAIEETTFQTGLHSDELLHVTMTFGVASIANADLEQVINEADRNLYIGKEQGKNRVVISSLG